jgi:glutamate racemase
MLQRILGRDVRLVSAGHAIAAAAQRLLTARGLEAADGVEGRYSFLCTGDVSSFRELGGRFLQMPLSDIERVDTLDG